MSHQVEREAVVSNSNLENSEHVRHRFDEVKKDFENSAATDSGYLSAPNITCSDIGHSSSDIGITSDSHPNFEKPSTTEKQATAIFDPSTDSGVIVDAREDDSNYHSQQSIGHDDNSRDKMFINSTGGLEEWICDLRLDQSNKLDGKQSKRLSYNELLELIFSQDDDGDT